MAKSPFLFKILSLYFWREKNLSPDFGVMVFFGLGRFLNLLGRGTSQVFFDKRPLNVGRHVEYVFYFKRLRDMASL